MEYIIFFSSDSCTRCSNPNQPQMTKLYLEFITTNLLPKLQKKIAEYEEWWIFKPNSRLASYIQKHKHMLQLYFRPTELIQIIKIIANDQNMYAVGNNDIIVLDKDLQECFNTSCIFIPRLYFFCLTHVNIVKTKKCDELKNEMIKDDFFVEVPLNIIYNDPTSKFWIPQKFITSYNYQRKKITYSWKDLNTLFVKHISKQENGIIQLNKSMFEIQSTCNFAKEFQFKFFHISQVPNILKQITKFLGKTNNLLTLCPTLKFKDHDPVIFWIEEMINQHNHELPDIPSWIYL